MCLLFIIAILYKSDKLSFPLRVQTTCKPYVSHIQVLHFLIPLIYIPRAVLIIVNYNEANFEPYQTLNLTMLLFGRKKIVKYLKIAKIYS